MDDRQCLIRCLTSPTLIRFYSIMNLVVWGTVLVLGQGVLPVLHGCAGVMIALEGIFAAASKNEDSIRLFMVLMLLNLVFCSIMGPLSALNIYQECYACAPNETIDGYGQLVLDNTSSEVLCAVSPFCERAFGLYGWILIIFGTILQLPIFLFTVGFYFSISRSPAKKQEVRLLAGGGVGSPGFVLYRLDWLRNQGALCKSFKPINEPC